MNNQNLPAGYWPENAPAYLSPKGWEFEKKLVKDRIAKSVELLKAGREALEK